MFSRRRIGLLVLGFAALSVLGLKSALAQEKTGGTAAAKIFQAGAAMSNITPPLGGLIVGGFNPFPSTHIHDELHARCLVLDNGVTRVAIVVCDLLGADRAVYEEAAKQVQEATGIQRSHLMMSSTHTHSAVSALGTDRFKYPQTELDEYQLFVAQRIADGVRRAVNNLKPARIAWGAGQEPDQVFNRRWFMKPGTVPVNPFGGVDQVKMNPPRASENLVKPAGPIDPEVAILSVQTKEGKPLALLANYSLHYVGGVGSGHVSADYFGVFCQRMAELVEATDQDPPFVALLSNGTSGNINNIDFSKPAGKSGPAYSKMREVADDVAKATHAAMKDLTYHDWVPLGAELRELELATRKPTPEQLQRATDLVTKPRLIGGRAALDVIYAERTLSMNQYPPTIAVPVQALRVGDVGICGSPFETFVETGLELKQKSPFKRTFTHSIANGYFGYLPTPEHHALGGYETWLGTNRFEPQASVKMTAMLLEMLNKLAGEGS